MPRTKTEKITELITTAIATADATMPDYRRAVEKLERGLKPRLAELERRRRDLLSGLAGVIHASDVDLRAQALLDDDAISKESERDRMLRVDLAAVEDELAVTKRAIALQQSVVARLHDRWSRAICDALHGEYQRQAAAVAAALLALHDALTDHRQFTEALHDADVRSWFWPLLWPGVQELRLDDPNSMASQWFTEARANGVIAG